jgi:hypothetical protein
MVQKAEYNATQRTTCIQRSVLVDTKAGVIEGDAMIGS